MTGLHVVVHIRRSAAKYVPMVSLRVVYGRMCTTPRSSLPLTINTLLEENTFPSPCPFTTKCSVIADPPVGYTGLRRSTHANRAVAVPLHERMDARAMSSLSSDFVSSSMLMHHHLPEAGTAFLSRCYDGVTSNDAAERLRQHFRLRHGSCHPCLHSEGGGAIGPKRSIYVNGREK
ncbi:hypothetical protein FB451DRAFT_1549177 [Mycena latifolia]|nr:hypothetical protein FB451DRAFT_1549177 [Mycena latifolia]